MPTAITASAPSDEAPASRFQQPHQRDEQHERAAHRQRSGAPGVGDLQRRRGDHHLVVGELVRGIDDEHEKDQRRGNGQHIEERAHRRRHHADDGGHAHVLAAAQCHHRTQHRQPQEQDRGQLVGPEERPVEDVARDHAGEQDDDLGHDEQRRRGLDGGPDCGLERHQPLRRARLRCEDGLAGSANSECGFIFWASQTQRSGRRLRLGSAATCSL